jgi:hypothetical protein
MLSLAKFSLPHNLCFFFKYDNILQIRFKVCYYMSYKLSEWTEKTLKSIYVRSEVFEYAYLKVLM